MLGLFFFQKYLTKLADFDFMTRWETKIVPYARRYFALLLIYYVVAVGVITQILTFGSDSFLFLMFVFFFTAVIYGIYFIRQLVKFIALNNTRFMQIKMGGTTSGFNKDNVVG